MARVYIVDMFKPIFYLAIAGLILFFVYFKEIKKRHIVYILSLIIAAAILIFYYGSWEFHDNPNKESFTIGNSYTRYWLPIYLGIIPFAAIAISKVTGILKIKWIEFVGSVIILLALGTVSINFVLNGSEEGLITSAKKVRAMETEFNEVLNLTEKNSLIITRYQDKLLFPERKVLFGLFDDDNMIAEYSKLIDILPVYYYNFKLGDKDLSYLNNRRLKAYGFKLRLVKEVGEFGLYILERSK